MRDKVDGAPGITGPISFDEKGDRVGVPYLLYVVDASGAIVASQ
jgi:ABC-type branched-subunit amino acid transport system substrate-binding protein